MALVSLVITPNSLTPGQMIGQLDRFGRVGTIAVGSNLLRVLSCYGRSSEDHPDLFPQAGLIEKADHLRHAPHGGRHISAHAQDVRLELAHLIHEVLQGHIDSEVYYFI